MNIGTSGNSYKSGELAVLNLVKSHIANKRNSIIFDVGANIGEYSLKAAEILSQECTIHSFEPSRHAFSQLAERTYIEKRIHAWNFGMSSEIQSADLIADRSGSSLASLYHRDLDHIDTAEYKLESVSLQTIDEFCKRENIGHIDFLKIDVEGHEFEVLKGAKNLIESGGIEIIQFEFGGTQIDSRTYLRDFYRLLQPHYNIHRVVKDGICLMLNYREVYEQFSFSNFIALHKKIATIK